MKFLTSSLPTKGVTIANGLITEIDIEPLTYKQLVTYTNRHYENDIDQMIAEIECFIQDIAGWHYISAYDLSSILFTRKFISATFENELAIPINGKKYTLNINELTFKDLNTELLDIKKITLGEKEFDFKIPTIEEYYKALLIVSSRLTSNDFWLNVYDTMILAALGIKDINADEYISIYSSASGDDVTTIKYIDRLLNNTVNDITVKGEGGDDSVINVQKLITDIFQLIISNRPLNKNKIKYSKRV